VRTLIAEILDAWRRAERLASEFPPGAVEHDAATLAAERLRCLYQDLTSTGVVEPLSVQEAQALLTQLRGDTSGMLTRDQPPS
jgi:hypothetical protein